MLAAPGMGMLIQEKGFRIQEKQGEFDVRNPYDEYQKDQLANSLENDDLFSPRVSLIKSSHSSDMPV